MPWGRDRSPLVGGEPAAVVLPRSTEEVAAVVRWARRAGVALVPAGGRTGYSGGAVAADGQVVVALERLNRLLAWHRDVPALTVEAGMLTRQLQRAATEEGWFFPVDFAACDRSQIGGNVATNAGGIRVIRYGMTGDWVLGLTVVTGSGEVLRLGGSRRRGALLKDNTGPPLETLFVGSEGAFGILTEVTVRLTRPPAARRWLAALAAESLEALLAMLATARRLPACPLAFECFDRVCHRLMAEHLGGPLLPENPPFLALVELEAATDELRSAARDWLRESPPAVDGRWIEEPEAQVRAWRYRLGISDRLAAGHRVHKNDLSVPVGALSSLESEVRRLAGEVDLPLAVFGHLGDGNLHINLLCPVAMDQEHFAALCQRFDEESYRRVVKLGGSISAEHGIGRLKRKFAHLTASPEERQVFRGLKRLFDPDGILNPGVGPF
ncbi:MAG: FAD-binding oxidoreductase [Acidobacteriota bacterium]